jgi:hypothetical protein
MKSFMVCGFVFLAGCGAYDITSDVREYGDIASAEARLLIVTRRGGAPFDETDYDEAVAAIRSNCAEQGKEIYVFPTNAELGLPAFAAGAWTVQADCI